MLIPLTDLIKKYNGKNGQPKLNITGVVHIGANYGQEFDAYYDNYIQNMVWIEAIPEVFKQLQKNMAGKGEHVICIDACIADVTGRKVKMGVTNNDGQSSSFLPMKEHLTAHPTVTMVRSEEMDTTTFDDVAMVYSLDMPKYNFLNMDIQGCELLALKGMADSLKYFDYIYTEVNTKELYEGCARVEEIDKFLAERGFKAMDCKMYDDLGWGDKFYMRVSGGIDRSADVEASPTATQQLPPTITGGPKEQEAAPQPQITSNKPANFSAEFNQAYGELNVLLRDFNGKLQNQVSGSVADNFTEHLRQQLVPLLERFDKAKTNAAN